MFSVMKKSGLPLREHFLFLLDIDIEDGRFTLFNPSELNMSLGF